MEIHDRLLEAYTVALTSPDQNNQCGAVIYDGDVMISFAANCFPDFISEEEIAEKINDRDWKLKHIRHAEALACHRLPYKCDELVMYSPWASCIECAKAIHANGIKKVYVHTDRMRMTPRRWQQSIYDGLDYLDEGGVEVLAYDAKINVPGIIANGWRWYG